MTNNYSENTNLSLNENNPKKNWFIRFWNYFTTYEKIWFLSLFVLTIISMILVPEESANGISGIIITILYVLDVILGLFCELLASKQSRWNFFIYNIVELIEIAIFIILKYRFASMAIAIFFWIPIHTISFINWNRHKDRVMRDKTVVRSLKWWQVLLLLVFTAAWTVGIGYLLALYGPDTEFFSSDTIKKVSAYLDACCSAVSIINGVLLLFRYKENWTVWFIYVIIETTINIITGQWVLLVLKLGYVTNTIYGYIKWTQYINSHRFDVVKPEENKNPLKLSNQTEIKKDEE